MAPPFGFTSPSGCPSSWATTSGTGAKARDLKRSMSLTLRSACASAFARAALDGDGEHQHGFVPATAMETSSRRGLKPRRSAPPRPVEALPTAAEPSTIGGVARRAAPVPFERGASYGEGVPVVQGGVLVALEPALAGSSGKDSRAEIAASMAVVAFSCEDTRTGRSCRAEYPPLRGDSSPPRSPAGTRVGQCSIRPGAEGSLPADGVPKPSAPGHVLDPAGHHQLGGADLTLRA